MLWIDSVRSAALRGHEGESERDREDAGAHLERDAEPVPARPELDDQDVGGHEGHDDRRADQPQPQPAEKSAALSPTVVARIFIAQKNTVT
jgi:hypothetical protein